jgi:hypothetical protein
MPSDVPLPPEIGAGSTSSPSSSSTKLSETLQQLTEAEERLAEELEMTAGVRRLARLSAVKDMRQNLEAEAKAFARELEHAGGIADDPADGEEEMDAMAGRDVIVHHHYGEGIPTSVAAPVAAPVAQPVSQPTAPAVAAPVPVVAKVGWTLGKVALAALGAGTGLGVPIAIGMAVLGALKPGTTVVTPSPPVIVQPDEDPFIGFGITVGKPE